MHDMCIYFHILFAVFFGMFPCQNANQALPKVRPRQAIFVYTPIYILIVFLIPATRQALS